MLRRERRWLRGYPEMSALASIHPHFILLTFFFAHAVMAGYTLHQYPGSPAESYIHILLSHIFQTPFAPLPAFDVSLPFILEEGE